MTKAEASAFSGTSQETYVSASVKEIDYVQLGIVNQAELKLQPMAFFSFCTAAYTEGSGTKPNKSCCSRLEAALKNSDRYDIDANKLYVELKSLDNYLPTENMRPLDVLNFLKQDDCYLNAIIAYKDFRYIGFSNAIHVAKQIPIEMDINSLFIQKRVIRRKRKFDEKFVEQDVILSAEESFKVNYFLYNVDQAIASLTTRFEQYQDYKDMFGFLFTCDKLKLYDDNRLKSCCSRLEAALKNGDRYDIDANEIYVELRKKLFKTEIVKVTLAVNNVSRKAKWINTDS
uniref:Zinc finger MYM-type protein 1 n=1 Tax=Tanacetum cinerariifolium TaxID=118510 RepID=A0A6L2J865_TANCI|nr:zinc finger MYM-type protein 1 [Tanacetum cinerariifolium]